MKQELKEIVNARDYNNMVGSNNHPIPGEYYITGLQAGNDDLTRYVGYCVQVRKKAGAFGSDIVFIRHPNGVLSTHENQFFFNVNDFWKDKIISLYAADVNPSEIDEGKAYTIGGEYPEVGKVIEPKESDRPLDESPLMKITTIHADGSKDIEIV